MQQPLATYPLPSAPRLDGRGVQMDDHLHMLKPHFKPVVLVVGGDAGTRLLIKFLLKDNGCHVVEITPASSMALSSRSRTVDLLIVADHGNEAAIDTVANLQRSRYFSPTLLLTRSISLTLRRQASALGVLGVISLPVSPRELQRRLQTELSNALQQNILPAAAASVVSAGGLVLGVDRRELSKSKNWTLRLTHTEARILQALMVAPGRVVARQDLVEHVWGEGWLGNDDALSIHIRRIRKKLGPPLVEHPYVSTVRGHGYIFDARSTPRPASAAPGKDSPLPLWPAYSSFGSLPAPV